MKTTMSKQILFLAVLGCMAAPVAAQTVDVTLQCGQSYTINSTVAATAATGLTYRWLENGSPVTGAAASYTVPATKSVGVYTYIRQAKTTGCTDWQNSNAFTVEVKNKEGIDGVCLGGLMWAKYNVDAKGSFTTNIADHGKLYQYGHTIAYDPALPLPPSLPAWNSTWSADSTVCPVGWREPTYGEWMAVRRDIVRAYTLTYVTKSDGSSAPVIWLGSREGEQYSVPFPPATYWCSTMNDATTARYFYLYQNSSGHYFANPTQRMNVRCVHD
jgi:uncharacterized protein (TIGR02145 family)